MRTKWHASDPVSEPLQLQVAANKCAFAIVGWTGGTIVLIAAYVISVWTLWQLCFLHEINGKRMNRYHELGQYAFGKRQAFLWYSSAAAASTATQSLQR